MLNGAQLLTIGIIIIIYHDFLPSPRRPSHVKSGNTHTIIQHTPLSLYTRHLRHDFQYVCHFYSLPRPHHLTASHPTPGDNHRSTGRRSERTHGQAKSAAWNLFSYICTRALHSFLSFLHCRLASTVIPLLPKTTFIPSIQPNHDLPHTRPPLTSAPPRGQWMDYKRRRLCK